MEIALSEVLASDSPAGSESASSASPKPGAGGKQPKRSQVSVAENVRIANDLTVHGEAWKLGGSAQWRVLSDPNPSPSPDPNPSPNPNPDPDPNPNPNR